MTPASPRPNRPQCTHDPYPNMPVTLISPKNSRAINKVSSALASPPPLLGPLEDIFQLLQDLFHSRNTNSALSKGVLRALFTIYQNLKVIRVHAIVQCQFANDLKIRLVDLKGQLEAARNREASSATAANNKKKDPKDLITSTPEPPLKKVFPVLAQTEKVVSTLQTFLQSKPRLQRAVPVAIAKLLQRMPDDLVRFPDHLARQLSACKLSLQRIVVLYNQLAEASKETSSSSLGNGPQSQSSSKSSGKGGVPSIVHLPEEEGHGASSYHRPHHHATTHARAVKVGARLHE